MEWVNTEERGKTKTPSEDLFLNSFSETLVQVKQNNLLVNPKIQKCKVTNSESHFVSVADGERTERNGLRAQQATLFPLVTD